MEAIDMEEVGIMAFDGASKIQNCFIRENWKGDAISDKWCEKIQGIFLNFLVEGPASIAVRKQVLVSSVDFYLATLEKCSTVCRGASSDDQKKAIETTTEKFSLEAIAENLSSKALHIENLSKTYLKVKS